MKEELDEVTQHEKVTLFIHCIEQLCDMCSIGTLYHCKQRAH
jgi:hypothetical protein